MKTSFFLLLTAMTLIASCNLVEKLTHKTKTKVDSKIELKSGSRHDHDSVVIRQKDSILLRKGQEVMINGVTIRFDADHDNRVIIAPGNIVAQGKITDVKTSQGHLITKVDSSARPTMENVSVQSRKQDTIALNSATSERNTDVVHHTRKTVPALAFSLLYVVVGIVVLMILGRAYLRKKLGLSI